MARARGTGSIFKPKGSSFYWFDYVSGGKRQYESTKSARKGDGQDLLTERLGLAQKGVVVSAKIGKLTLSAGSGQGRTFYVTEDLRTLLQHQLASIDGLKDQGTITPYVFHYPDGSPIRDFRKSWRTACKAVGYPDKIFHDFRRTAVRNLERPGVPRSTAMAMVGHQTESIYRRYAIADEAMHREAAARLDTWASE